MRVMFQFLIGSLETLQCARGMGNGDWFQFLIGSLETEWGMKVIEAAGDGFNSL